MDLPIDAVLADRYRIVERRGRGGMAVVYSAHDEVLDRRVAVKVLAQHLLDDPRAVDRFEREARAAARLSHPNVVAVHDAASDGDTHFLVMELIDGTTLADRLREDTTLDVDDTLDLADQVGAALAAAHAAGMVHRDVKPSNILLTADGRVKVADFGIARAVASAATQTAVVMGSVPYVAPEQLDGSSGADPRSDLYALGCVLHECLTGRPPFVADTSAAVLGQHLHLDPAAVSARRDVPPGVDALVAGLLAKDPADRPASAEVFRQQVARVRAGGMPDDGAGSAGAGVLASGAAAGAAAAGARGAARVTGADDDANTEAMGARDAEGATERIDPAATPTEVIDDDGARTAVLPGTAGAVVPGATGRAADGSDGTTDAPGGVTPADPAPGGGRGWWVAAALLVLLALGTWAWSSWFSGDDPTPVQPTPSASTPATTEAEEPATEEPTSTEPDPTTTAPAEPTPAPTTSPTPAPTTARPTTTPTTPPPTSPPSTTSPPSPPTVSPTAAQIADIRDLLADGVDRGQLTDDAAAKIAERLTAVNTRLSSGDADRLDKARDEITAVRQEIDQQVADGQANRGIANQLQAEVDEVEATLA